LAKANVTLSWDQAVVDYLAKAGFERQYGARPLQRAIERLVVAPLARWLLDRPETRDCGITLRLDENGIQCHRA
jgi:ATP-dependent Clp protease ATP-binding subunit ClpC